MDAPQHKRGVSFSFRLADMLADTKLIDSEPPAGRLTPRLSLWDQKENWKLKQRSNILRWNNVNNANMMNYVIRYGKLADSAEEVERYLDSALALSPRPSAVSPAELLCPDNINSIKIFLECVLLVILHWSQSLFRLFQKLFRWVRGIYPTELTTSTLDDVKGIPLPLFSSSYIW